MVRTCFSVLLQYSNGISVLALVLKGIIGSLIDTVADNGNTVDSPCQTVAPILLSHTKFRIRVHFDLIGLMRSMLTDK